MLYREIETREPCLGRPTTKSNYQLLPFIRQLTAAWNVEPTFGCIPWLTCSMISILARWKVCGSVSCLNQSPLIVPERLWHTNIPISCSEPSAPRRGHCSVRHEAWAGLCAERSSGIPLTSPNIGAAGSWPTMIFECVASSIELSTKYRESFHNICLKCLPELLHFINYRNKMQC